MADKKISQLTTLAQADVAVTADFLPIVDTSATETKKATPQALVQAGATGATLPVALGAVGTPSYTFTGDLNTGLWSPAADTLAASTGGSERLRVDSSGNVGIGTIALTARGNLDISSGNTGTAITKSIHLGYSAADFYGYRIANTNTAASFAAGTFSIQRGTTAAWVDDFVINDSGNLGIGTASPAQRLDVQHTTNGIGMRLRNTSTGVELATRTDATTSGIDAGNAPNGMTFSLNTVEGMRLTSTGLGIGTASPGGRLHITTASGNTDFVHNVTGSGTAARTSYQRGGTVQFFAGLGAWSGTDTYQIASSTGPLTTLDTSGNLGIGTASPTALLDVNADTMRLRTARTPASATAAGNAGDICWDATYLYICTATNTWRRIQHATW